MQRYGKLGKTAEVAISCFIGGSFGALIALRLNGDFWWLGMIAGGLVGYLVYELPQVITAARIAIRTVFTIWPEEVARAVGRSWITVRERKEGALIGAISGLAAFALIALILGLRVSIGDVIASPVFSAGLVLTYAVFGACIGLWANPRWKEVASFIRQIPGMLLALLRALLLFLRLIHSDLRMIVGLDSALSAWIGYLAGNPLIGGVGGAVIGVISYLVVQRLQLLTTKNAENTA